MFIGTHSGRAAAALLLAMIASGCELSADESSAEKFQDGKEVAAVVNDEKPNLSAKSTFLKYKRCAVSLTLSFKLAGAFEIDQSSQDAIEGHLREYLPKFIAVAETQGIGGKEALGSVTDEVDAIVEHLGELDEQETVDEVKKYMGQGVDCVQS